MTPYEILGVPTNASQDQIRKAYREKVKKFHPDLISEDEQKLFYEEITKQLNAAYFTLRNKEETPVQPPSTHASSSQQTQQAKRYEPIHRETDVNNEYKKQVERKWELLRPDPGVGKKLWWIILVSCSVISIGFLTGINENGKGFPVGTPLFNVLTCGMWVITLTAWLKNIRNPQ